MPPFLGLLYPQPVAQIPSPPPSLPPSLLPAKALLAPSAPAVSAHNFIGAATGRVDAHGERTNPGTYRLAFLA